MNVSQIKEIIRRDLPAIMREDPETKAFVLNLVSTQFADKKETESRFDQVLDELRRDREEQSRKWEEESRKWEEQSRKWEENQQVIRKLYDKYETGIGALGARWGINAEETFRNALKGILEFSFGVEVLNVTEYDDAGEVFGAPDQVEIDIIIKNGTLMICEIKSSMSRGDVYLFGRKIDFYEKRHNRKADRKLIISPMVDIRGKKIAEKLNMEVYTCTSDIQSI